MPTFLETLGIRCPLVQAPMAGGPDSPQLAAAVSDAGGLGSVGCAYLSPESIAETIAAVRARTKRAFAVNLFIRQEPRPDEAARQRVAAALNPFRKSLGLSDPPAPLKSLPSIEAQLAAVVGLKPAVFSFTFGMPRPDQMAALRAARILTIGTATSLEEGKALQSLGVDAICAQGSEAGGHRGTFIGETDDALIGTLALTRQLTTQLRVPVLAAGGIMDGAGIRAVLQLGAAAAQLGTAFMLCPEAGTHPAHRQALRSPLAQYTVLTRAFSGRAARGIRNRFSDAFGSRPEQVEPAPFPLQQALTAELRAAAGAHNRTDLMQLWCGQGAVLIRELPAAKLVEVLMAEAGIR